ncbi:MAG: hypothetical protein H6760_04035 [Candidatus Nomurabacteria bacterium]|nr:MAG: hypothetical protein H6760_04035 [Candidatus Nomurabacteria bacterium]
MKAVNAGEHGNEHVRVCVVIEGDENRDILEIYAFAREVQAIEPDEPQDEASDGERVLICCECPGGDRPRFADHDQLIAFLRDHNSGHHASVE